MRVLYINMCVMRYFMCSMLKNNLQKLILATYTFLFTSDTLKFNGT